MLSNLRHNISLGQSTRVSIFICGRRPGVPMYRLVSTEEEHTSALQALNACVGIVRVGSICRGSVRCR